MVRSKILTQTSVIRIFCDVMIHFNLYPVQMDKIPELHLEWCKEYGKVYGYETGNLNHQFPLHHSTKLDCMLDNVSHLFWT